MESIARFDRWSLRRDLTVIDESHPLWNIYGIPAHARVASSKGEQSGEKHELHVRTSNVWIFRSGTLFCVRADDSRKTGASQTPAASCQSALYSRKADSLRLFEGVLRRLGGMPCG